MMGNTRRELSDADHKNREGVRLISAISGFEGMQPLLVVQDRVPFKEDLAKGQHSLMVGGETVEESSKS